MNEGARNEAWDRLVDEMEGAAGVKRSAMFGMPCLKVGTKAFAGLWKDGGVTFKLTGDAHARALGLDGAALFDPGMGKPMREWVLVPSTQASSWADLARSSLEYVGSLAR